jgi:hypothetical protein
LKLSDGLGDLGSRARGDVQPRVARAGDRNAGPAVEMPRFGCLAVPPRRSEGDDGLPLSGSVVPRAQDNRRVIERDAGDRRGRDTRLRDGFCDAV